MFSMNIRNSIEKKNFKDFKKLMSTKSNKDEVNIHIEQIIYDIERNEFIEGIQYLIKNNLYTYTENIELYEYQNIDFLKIILNYNGNNFKYNSSIFRNLFKNEDYDKFSLIFKKILLDEESKEIIVNNFIFFYKKNNKSKNLNNIFKLISKKIKNTNNEEYQQLLNINNF